MRAAPPEPCCRLRRPYSRSDDFEANAAMILVVLFCALICALSLNAAIRCFLRDRLPRRQGGDKPASSVLVVVPTVAFSAEVELAGAEAECAICLSEFVEGEGIKVVGRCRHGFHVQCIEKWFRSQTSCPTCRTTCLPNQPQLTLDASSS